MYKVFVDHKPVILIENRFVPKDSLSIDASEVSILKDDVKTQLKNVNIGNPLFIICQDVHREFERIFADYKKLYAAGGLVQRNQKYLIIKRKGLWDIPKGGIDKGEKAKDAAIREIEEECGISGHQIVDKLCTTYHLMKWKGTPALKRTKWYMMRYSGSKETTPQLKEGITKAKWVNSDELLAIRGNTYGSINDVLDAWFNRP